jgi:hypothetical protein
MSASRNHIGGLSSEGCTTSGCLLDSLLRLLPDEKRRLERLMLERLLLRSVTVLEATDLIWIQALAKAPATGPMALYIGAQAQKILVAI